ELATLAVFDRECERGFIDEQGEVAFLPPALGLFDELVKTLDEVRRLIQAEAGATRPSDSLQDIRTDFVAYPSLSAILDSIKPDLDDAKYADIEAKLQTATWDETLEARLAEAERLLVEAREPEKHAQLLRSVGARLREVRSR